MKRALVVFVLGFGGIALTALAARANITIVNESLWDIHHLYLSSVDDEEWGPDQLGREVIGSGETFVLRGVPCDDYDVKLVDEDGDVCEIREVDICGGQHRWVITDEDLLACQGY
jgi:hypothetical protein